MVNNTALTDSFKLYIFVSVTRSENYGSDPSTHTVQNLKRRLYTYMKTADRRGLERQGGSVKERKKNVNTQQTNNILRPLPVCLGIYNERLQSEFQST